MSFIRYEGNTGPAVGFVTDGQVYPVPSDSLAAALCAPRPDITGTGVPIADVKLLPALDPDAKILCVALNYVNHAKEANQSVPETPIIFFKSQEAMIAADSDIVTPEIVTELDYEGELAIIIGKAGYGIAEADVWDHIAGVTCFNDISARNLLMVKAGEKTHIDWFSGKCIGASTPIGPEVVPTAEIINELKAKTIHVTTKVNGETRQDASIEDMVFDIPTLVVFASSRVELRPGDVIATGTPPGVGLADGRYLAKGDIVEIGLTGVPSLRNRVA